MIVSLLPKPKVTLTFPLDRGDHLRCTEQEDLGNLNFINDSQTFLTRGKKISGLGPERKIRHKNDVQNAYLTGSGGVFLSS